MSKCETCKWKNEEDGWAICDLCVNDPALEDRYKPFTNADHIRAMTDEEMASFMILSPEMEFDVCCFCRYGNTTTADDRGQCLALYSCDGNARAEAFRKWLQQPWEEGTV